MDDGEFDHGGGGGGSGSPAAVALVAVAAMDELAAKVAGNKSVDSGMMVCDNKSRWQTTMQQPTNNGSSKGGWW